MKTSAIVAAFSLLLLSPAAMAASPYDGIYSGSATWAGNSNRRCNNLPDFKITVREGRFNYGRDDDRVPVVVAPDGSFSAQSGQRYLQGKISGNQLSATASGGTCNYQWDLKK